MKEISKLFVFFYPFPGGEQVVHIAQDVVLSKIFNKVAVTSMFRHFFLLASCKFPNISICEHPIYSDYMNVVCEAIKKNYEKT